MDGNVVFVVRYGGGVENVICDKGCHLCPTPATKFLRYQVEILRKPVSGTRVKEPTDLASTIQVVTSLVVLHQYLNAVFVAIPKYLCSIMV